MIKLSLCLIMQHAMKIMESFTETLLTSALCGDNEQRHAQFKNK